MCVCLKVCTQVIISLCQQHTRRMCIFVLLSPHISHERQKTRPLLQVHICLRSKEPWLHAQLRVDLLYSYFYSRTLTLSQIQLYSDACPVQGLTLFFVLKCFTPILLVITFNVSVIFPNYINVFFSQGHIFQRSWMIVKHKYRTFWELTVIRQH